MEIKVQTVSNNWQIGWPGGTTVILGGTPKSGKSTLASKWSVDGQKGVIIIDCDLGSDYVDGANIIPCTSLDPPTRPKMKDGIKVVDAKGADVLEVIPPEERGFYYRTGDAAGTPMPTYSLREIISWLTSSWSKLEYKTIVIDDIGTVNGWFEVATMNELGISSLSDGEYGSGWATSRNKFMAFFNSVQRFTKKVGATLVLVAHTKQTTIVEKKAQLVLDLPSGLSRVICAKSELIAFLSKDVNGDYLISFKNSDEKQNGSRLAPLTGKTLKSDFGVIVEEIKSYKE